jgi:hypothetical protein
VLAALFECEVHGASAVAISPRSRRFVCLLCDVAGVQELAARLQEHEFDTYVVRPETHTQKGAQTMPCGTRKKPRKPKKAV